MEIAKYGTWKSKITREMLLNVRCIAVLEVQVSEESVYWIEQAVSDGCCSIYRYESSLTDPVVINCGGRSVRNAVHEFGGASYIVNGGVIYFICDEGIFCVGNEDFTPQLLVPSVGGYRYANLDYHEGFLYGVFERHCDDSVVNGLLVVNLTAQTAEKIIVHDFCASVCVSPNGRYICWIEWVMGNMPWDETKLVIADRNPMTGMPIGKWLIQTERVNYHGIQWSRNAELYVICDSTGWWNVYKVDFDKQCLGENVYSVASEIGKPPWQFGDKQYATNKHGVLLNVPEKLLFIKHTSQKVQLCLDDYSNFSYLTLDDNNTAYFIASGPKRLSTVVKYNIDAETLTVIREVIDCLFLESLDISVPVQLSLNNGSGCGSWLYKPHSTIFKGPDHMRPPLLVMVHGGPTSQAYNTLNLKVQSFTTRGFAVLDVNYTGSSGFGKKFRDNLRLNWGVVDRDDVINATNYLCESELVDRERICIMGGSAGGFLALTVIMHCDLFASAACFYGVSDLAALYENIHKFEKGYNEFLLGPPDVAKEVCNERSPINNGDKLKCPVIFFHGDSDKVVPLEQSKKLFEVLKSKAMPTSLVVFPGEGHGFRTAKAITQSLDGAYYFFCRTMRIELPSDCTHYIRVENLDE